jgi:hypothetical protein
VSLSERLAKWPRERLAERLSAACYGTVLVLVALPLIHPDDVSNGLGWELVTGVGLATWIAHLYAELVADRVHQSGHLVREEVVTAMTDGAPILLAAVAPALALGLGRLGALDERVALWTAVGVAILQLVGVGAFVGSTVSRTGRRRWSYAAFTAAVGIAVVTLKLALGH